MIVQKTAPATSSPRDRQCWLLVIPFVLLFALIVLKPVPLVGGFTDDFRYLVGAQCLDCLPTNHWERRFAIVWPTGIALKLFGQNLWSVMIFPVAAAVAAIVLTFKLVEHRYGRKAALIACCVLVLTPVLSERAMRISIDIVELVFLLGSVLVLQRRKGHFWAGALIALAILCRPTQFAALPMVAFLAWWQDPRSLKWFALGFVAPLAAEALAYLIVAGDPLYPWKLSLNHMDAWRAAMEEVRYGQFISREVDTSQSPLFNPEFIGGWRPVARIEAHWTIQGLVNLLVSPEAAMTLWTGLLFSLLAWKRLDRLQLALILCSALFFGALTYAFAVDPRPRMFLPIVVVAAALIGSLAPKLWLWPRKIVVVTMLALILVVGVVKAINRIDYRPSALLADKLLASQPYQVTSNTRQRLALIRQDFPAGGRDLIEIDDVCAPREAGRWLAHRDGDLCIYAGPAYNREHQRIQLLLSPVAEWIAAHPGQIEIDADTRRYLDPLKVARGLPGIESDRRYLLLQGTNSCKAWLARNGLPKGSLSRVEEGLSGRTAFLGNDWAGSLCLFRYERDLSPGDVRAAIAHARADPLYRLEPRTTFDPLRPRVSEKFGKLFRSY